MDNRNRIDPEGRYPAPEATRAEEGALRILHLLRYRASQIFDLIRQRREALSGNPEHAEEELLRIRELLRMPKLERTRDAIQIDYLEQHGLVFLATPEGLEIRLPALEWVVPHWSAPSSRLWQRVSWSNLPATEFGDSRLLEIILAALEARAAEFQQCRFCKRSVPAEHRRGDVCRNCAEQRRSTTG